MGVGGCSCRNFRSSCSCLVLHLSLLSSAVVFLCIVMRLSAPGKLKQDFPRAFLGVCSLSGGYCNIFVILNIDVYLKKK